jgi:alpha-beta hydrolase superfamily lysophospholipase
MPTHGTEATQGLGKVMTLVAPDGVPLVIRHWAAPGCRATLFYLHGIQSHSGWLFETGPRLARHGVEVYALDRRGSGMSGGPRGHLPSAQTVLDDYTLALRTVRARSDGRPVSALGQSLGGSILAALCARGEPGLSQLIFSAPALGQQHRRHGPEELDRLRGLAGGARVPVGLEDRHYTKDPRYLGFMAADELILREITEQTRATLIAIEDTYWRRLEGGARLGPTALALPRTDRIIDSEQSRRVLMRLTDRPQVRTFATDSHYLEFSDARDEYWGWVADLVARTDAPSSRPGQEH